MNGLVWCIRLTVGGAVLALLGLWLQSEALMAAGGGAVATVWFGWPVLVLMGALSGRTR